MAKVGAEEEEEKHILRVVTEQARLDQYQRPAVIGTRKSKRYGVRSCCSDQKDGKEFVRCVEAEIRRDTHSISRCRREHSQQAEQECSRLQRPMRYAARLDPCTACDFSFTSPVSKCFESIGIATTDDVRIGQSSITLFHL